MASHLKILDLITSAKSLFPNKVTFPRVLGIRTWTYLSRVAIQPAAVGGGACLPFLAAILVLPPNSLDLDPELLDHSRRDWFAFHLSPLPRPASSGGCSVMGRPFRSGPET